MSLKRIVGYPSIINDLAGLNPDCTHKSDGKRIVVKVTQVLFYLQDTIGYDYTHVILETAPSQKSTYHSRIETYPATMMATFPSSVERLKRELECSVKSFVSPPRRFSCAHCAVLVKVKQSIQLLQSSRFI